MWELDWPLLAKRNNGLQKLFLFCVSWVGLQKAHRKNALLFAQRVRINAGRVVMCPVVRCVVQYEVHFHWTAIWGFELPVDAEFFESRSQACGYPLHKHPPVHVVVVIEELAVCLPDVLGCQWLVSEIGASAVLLSDLNNRMTVIFVKFHFPIGSAPETAAQGAFFRNSMH